MNEFQQILSGLTVLCSFGALTAVLKVWKTQGIHNEQIQTILKGLSAFAIVPERLVKIETKLDSMLERSDFVTTRADEAARRADEAARRADEATKHAADAREQVDIARRHVEEARAHVIARGAG